MNVFRLVLCFAGLAAYLIAKQTLPSSEANILLPKTVQGSTPSESKPHTERDPHSKCKAAIEATEPAQASHQAAEAKQ